jgi:hypothetical protein
LLFLETRNDCQQIRHSVVDWGSVRWPPMPSRKRNSDPEEPPSADPQPGKEASRRRAEVGEPVDATVGDTGLLGGVDEANEDLDAFSEPEGPLEESETAGA